MPIAPHRQRPVPPLADRLSPPVMSSLQSAWTAALAARPELGLSRPEEYDEARCKADICYWIETYVRTYDPRLLAQGLEAYLPFHLFARQREFLTWLKEREERQENGVAEKSRDVGLTWLCVCYALHGWLFRKGFAAGFGANKAELVDNLGNPSTIFEKMRMAYRGLPEWMLPAGFKPDQHDNLKRLINPANGATIIGEGGDSIGRGGRSLIYFVDEAAHIEHPQSVAAALSQTCRTQIDVSTPNGPGNDFHRKRDSGNVEVFTFHWKEDPRKNAYSIYDTQGREVGAGSGYAPAPPEGGSVVYPWYVAECRRIDNPIIVAQEIDISYTASLEGICIPDLWVRAAVDLDLPQSGDLEAGFDIGEEGPDDSVLIFGRGPVILPLNTKHPGVVKLEKGNTTKTAWAARDVLHAYECRRVKYDADGPGMGIKGTWQTSEKKLDFAFIAVHGGASPSERHYGGKPAKDVFLNYRTELWWNLRRRFEKTYEYCGGDGQKTVGHPVDELISIPRHPKLIAQLSQPKLESTDTGKLRLESKLKMRGRGVPSPDYADALAYRFARGGIATTAGAVGQRVITGRPAW